MLDATANIADVLIHLHLHWWHAIEMILEISSLPFSSNTKGRMAANIGPADGDQPGGTG
jgi:hypothetical protein